MSNHSLKARILVALDEYSASTLTATDVERTIETLMGSLESIGLRQIEAARDLSRRLVDATLADGAAIECIGDESVDAVLADFRAFIELLPD
jgi:hypothetical protein